MTVIVWDGETLAADRLVTNGYTIDATTKIFEINDRLYACTGEAHMAQALLAWHTAGADPAKMPRVSKDEEHTVLLVFFVEPATGTPVTLHYATDKPPYASRLEGKTTWGVGDEAAAAGLALGLDAIAAVRLACKVNIKCGNGIDALRLGGWHKRFTE
jgi:hypothetical protein